MRRSVEIENELAAILKRARPAVLEVRAPNLEEQRAAVSSLKGDPIMWALLAQYLRDDFGTDDPEFLSEEELKAAVRRAAVLIDMLSAGHTKVHRLENTG